MLICQRDGRHDEDGPLADFGEGQRAPHWVAFVIRAAELFTSYFCMRLRRWVSTVCGLMYSWAAMAFVVAP